jgi:hypothetical protein
MRIEFQLTEADFAESQLGRPPGLSKLLLAIWPWLLILLLAFSPVLVWVTRGEANSSLSWFAWGHATTPPDEPAERAWHLLRVTSPAVFILLVAFFSAILATVRAIPSPWKQVAGKQAVLPSTWIIGAASGILMMWSLYQPRTAYEAALIAPPTALVMAWVATWVIIFQTIGLRRRWQAQRHLHLPITMEVPDGERVTFRDALTIMEYRWGAIEGYKETPNLLLLYLSPLSMWIVPKRAFLNPMDLGHLKGMLTVHVREGFLLPQAHAPGFQVMTAPMPAVPVLPAAQPPPLPTPSQTSQGSS